MDIDQLIAEDFNPLESVTGQGRPDGVDPESDSWLDAALLSDAVAPEDREHQQPVGSGRLG